MNINFYTNAVKDAQLELELALVAIQKCLVLLPRSNTKKLLLHTTLLAQ